MRFLAVLSVLGALLLPSPTLVSFDPNDTRLAADPDPLDALAVLHAWDARRARAWADLDTRELRSLYVSGSGAGRADVRLLLAYQARGLVVRRMLTQVFAIRVMHLDPTKVRVSVYDRVAGGELVGRGHAVALHSSRPVTRTIEFRRSSGGWRVAGVSGSGGAPHAARRARQGPGG